MKKIIGSLFAIMIISAVHAQNLVYDANAQVRKAGSFHGVSVGSGIVLYLSQGKEQAVAVSAEEEKYTERIITEVKDGILKIRVDGKLLVCDKGAPQLGEHNEEIDAQFGLAKELQPVIKR